VNKRKKNNDLFVNEFPVFVEAVNWRGGAGEKSFSVSGLAVNAWRGDAVQPRGCPGRFLWFCTCMAWGSLRQNVRNEVRCAGQGAEKQTQQALAGN
jgi:hypothetical protein